MKTITIISKKQLSNRVYMFIVMEFNNGINSMGLVFTSIQNVFLVTFVLLTNPLHRK